MIPEWLKSDSWGIKERRHKIHDVVRLKYSETIKKIIYWRNRCSPTWLWVHRGDHCQKQQCGTEDLQYQLLHPDNQRTPANDSWKCWIGLEVLSAKTNFQYLSSKSYRCPYRDGSQQGHGQEDDRRNRDLCNMSNTQTWFPGNQLAYLNPPEIHTGLNRLTPVYFSGQWHIAVAMCH